MPNLAGDALDLRGNARGWNSPFIFLGEVNVIAQQRLDLNQGLPQRTESARQATLELAESAGGLSRGGRVDQVAHGFGLNQVELAIEDRPAGELARRGCTGARRVQSGQEPARDLQAAMAGELHQVLSGVALRTRERHVDPAIDELAVGPIELRQVGPAGRGRGEPPDHSLRHREWTGPAQADRSESRAAGGSGECGD